MVSPSSVSDDTLFAYVFRLMSAQYALYVAMAIRLASAIRQSQGVVLAGWPRYSIVFNEPSRTTCPDADPFYCTYCTVLYVPYCTYRMYCTKYCTVLYCTVLYSIVMLLKYILLLLYYCPVLLYFILRALRTLCVVCHLIDCIKLYIQYLLCCTGTYYCTVLL